MRRGMKELNGQLSRLAEKMSTLIVEPHDNQAGLYIQTSSPERGYRIMARYKQDQRWYSHPVFSDEYMTVTQLYDHIEYTVAAMIAFRLIELSRL